MSNVLPFRRPAPAPSPQLPESFHIAALPDDIVEGYIQLMVLERRHEELFAFLSCLRTFRPLIQKKEFSYMVRIPQPRADEPSKQHTMEVC